ncbi:MAG: hypothetical protein ACRDLP_01010 [Solirubrobacteraceae bacterium]
MSADELDRAYVLLSQAISRVAEPDHALFLSRLVLLLLAGHPDVEAAMTAIRDAELRPAG